MINLKDYSDFDFSEVRLLLSECMWPDEDRISEEINLYISDDSRELYGRFINDELIGLIGIIRKSIIEVELKHIAIRSDYRKQGIGRDMIFKYIADNGILIIKAETDLEAVDFYKNIGFHILNLGEKYPGVNRYRCIYSMEGKDI